MDEDTESQVASETPPSPLIAPAARSSPPSIPSTLAPSLNQNIIVLDDDEDSDAIATDVVPTAGDAKSEVPVDQGDTLAGAEPKAEVSSAVQSNVPTKQQQGGELEDSEADAALRMPQLDPSSQVTSAFETVEATAGEEESVEGDLDIPESPPKSPKGYRDLLLSSNPSLASMAEAPSSDFALTFPPPGQAPPSTPPRSSTSQQPSSNSTIQGRDTQTDHPPSSSYVAPTQVEDSPDPMRIVPAPSSVASDRYLVHGRSRSRSMSVPLGTEARRKVASEKQSGPPSDPPTSSAPTISQPRVPRASILVTRSENTVNLSEHPSTESTAERPELVPRISDDIIIEDSPAENLNEPIKRQIHTTFGKDKGKGKATMNTDANNKETSSSGESYTRPRSRLSFDSVTIPKSSKSSSRAPTPRTGANENDPENPFVVPASRKQSASRNRSTTPATDDSPPLTSGQAGAPSVTADVFEAHHSVEVELEQPPSPRPTTVAGRDREFGFAVVVPPRSRTSSVNSSRRQSNISIPSDAEAAVPAPTHEESARLRRHVSSSDLSSQHSSPMLSSALPPKRVRSSTSTSEHSASESEAGPSRHESPTKKRKETGAPKRSPKGNKKTVIAALGSDDEADLSMNDAGASTTSLAKAVGKRPRRAAIKPAVKESSDESHSGSESGTSDKSSSEAEAVPKKKPKPAPKRIVSQSAPKAKINGNKEPPKVKALVALGPTSSFAMPPSSQLLALAKMDTAPFQTAEQRKEKWSLNRMDSVVWTLVEAGSTRFWWPAAILSKPQSSRPLLLSLLADSENDILRITPRQEMSLEEPTFENLLSFRTPVGALLRFDGNNFIEVAGDSEAPSVEAFDRSLAAALLKLDADEFSDDEEDVLPIIASAKIADKTANKTASLSKAVEDDSDAPSGAPDSDNELTKAEDEAELQFPFKCLAKNKQSWWPAYCLSYEKPISSQASSKKTQNLGNFILKWSDDTRGKVKRAGLLTPSDPKFFTVKVGESALDVDRDYTADLAEFVAHETAVWQAIIDDEFGPAKKWTDEFYAGGNRRLNVTKLARYGEFLEEHRDALTVALTKWALPQVGPRPTGGADYENLSDMARSTFIVDVLLSVALVLVTVEERDFEDTAEHLLNTSKSENDPDRATRDQIIARAFELAQEALEEGSLEKWVASARAARSQAKKNRKL
ncbi:hypothetical protein P7C70_g1398, partial [Phenoliferia sp. Uapishka_3]